MQGYATTTFFPRKGLLRKIKSFDAVPAAHNTATIAMENVTIDRLGNKSDSNACITNGRREYPTIEQHEYKSN